MINTVEKNEKFGEILDYETVEAGFENNYYVTRTEYDDGYAKINGQKIKLTDDCELRVRFVKHDFIILSPKFCSIYNAQLVTHDIDDIYKKYSNNEFNMAESFLESIIPPKAKRNIQRLAIDFS